MIYLRQTYIKSTVNCAQLRPQKSQASSKSPKCPKAVEQADQAPSLPARLARPPCAARLANQCLAHGYGAHPSFETLPSSERWLPLRASVADLPVQRAKALLKEVGPS